MMTASQTTHKSDLALVNCELNGNPSTPTAVHEHQTMTDPARCTIRGSGSLVAVVAGAILSTTIVFQDVRTVLDRSFKKVSAL